MIVLCICLVEITMHDCVMYLFGGNNCMIVLCICLVGITMHDCVMYLFGGNNYA